MKKFLCLLFLLFFSSSIWTMEDIDVALQNKDCPTAVRIFGGLKNPSVQLILDLLKKCPMYLEEKTVIQCENITKEQEYLFSSNNIAFIYYNLAHNRCLNYLQGKGEVDLHNAIRFYKYAADLGHVDAPGMLGQFYEQGRGVEKDLHEAIRLYKLSFDRGSVEAEKFFKKNLDFKK